MENLTPKKFEKKELPEDTACESLVKSIESLTTEISSLKEKIKFLETTLNINQENPQSFSDTFCQKHLNYFRGSSEKLKNQFSFYLPYINRAKAGTADSPILDLGCGRGEWLELLKEKGLAARGIDSSSAMIQELRIKGFDVIHENLLAYLKSISDNSLGAITGFHIVEHLSYPNLLTLMDETVRTLKPGGISIFETPNPLNLFVGACNFYSDPTHVRPLPSALLKFIAEMRGLRKVEIFYLHPTIKMLSKVYVLKHFYGPRDYAIIGYKD